MLNFATGSSRMRLPWSGAAAHHFARSSRKSAPYGQALYRDPDVALADLRKAVTTLEDARRIARRVLGGAHPTTVGIESSLENSRGALRARETPSPR